MMHTLFRVSEVIHYSGVLEIIHFVRNAKLGVSSPSFFVQMLVHVTQLPSFSHDTFFCIQCQTTILDQQLNVNFPKLRRDSDVLCSIFL